MAEADAASFQVAVFPHREAASEFEKEPGFADPRLPNDPEHPAGSGPRLVEAPYQLLDGLLPAYERCEPPCRSGIEPGREVPDPGELKDLLFLLLPLDPFFFPSSRNSKKSLASRWVLAVSRIFPVSAICSMRAARLVVSPTAV